MNSLRKTLLVLALSCLPGFALAAANPMIISVTNIDPAIPYHIGSAISLSATAGDVTQVVTLSPVTPAATTTLDLIVSGVPNGTILYVSDTYHTWRTTVTLGKVTLTDAVGVLICGEKIVAGSITYVDVVNRPFTGYVTVGGVLLKQSDGPSFEVELGAIARITMKDDGIQDLAANDGIWGGTYDVQVLGPNPSDFLTNVRMVGHLVYLGSQASNDPFTGNKRIASIDGQVPKVSNISFSSMPNNLNYNGVIYVAATSMGTSGPNPNNATAILDVQTNKQNCKLRLQADTDPLGVNPLVLPQVPIGSATEYPLFWTARDKAGNFVYDGSYTLEVGIEDQYGIVGVTATVRVSVTSLIMEIKNPRMQPASIPANLLSTAITNINYDVYVHNDFTDYLGNGSAAAGASLRPALINLGWTETGPGAVMSPGQSYHDIYNYKSGIYSLMETKVLNADAAETLYADLSEKDLNGLHNDDQRFATWVRGDPAIGKSPDCQTVFQYPGFSAYPGPNILEAVAPNFWWFFSGTGMVNRGDCNPSNDWNTAFNPECHLSPTAGTLLDPKILKASWGLQWQSQVVPAQGTYRMSLVGILTGMEEINISYLGFCGEDDLFTCFNGIATSTFTPSPTPTGTVSSTVSPTPTPVVANSSSNSVHFYPSAKPELGFSSDFRGRGIFAQDKSLVFSVTAPVASNPDTTAPVIISSDPIDGTSKVQPGKYGPTPVYTPISIHVEDPESPVDTVQSSVSLTRTLGGSTFTVAGISSSDGGTTGHDATFYFYPNAPLVNGGSYDLKVVLCNKGTLGSGACTTRHITFNIEDSAAPALSQAVAIDAVSANFDVMTPPTLPLGSLDKIQVVLTMPTQAGTTNIISDTGSFLTLTNTNTNAQVPISVLSKTLNASNTALTMSYKLNQTFFGSASFRIDITAVSQNATDPTKTYQALNLPAPVFYTTNSANILNICQGGGCPTSDLIATMIKPITIFGSLASFSAAATYITASATTLTGLAIQPSLFPALPNGFAALPNTVGLQFGAGSTRLYNVAFSGSVAPVTVNVYFDTSNIPQGVTPTSVSVKGYTARFLNPWTDLISVNSAPLTNGQNNFTFSFPMQSPAVTIPDLFVVVYPSSAAQVASTQGGSVSPTPVRSTRSFNPLSLDPMHNQAKIYYSETLPAAQLEVKVYNISGTLVRTLNPANLTLSNPGTTSYYFLWDGANDSGATVRNGIYLVRFEARLTDGTVQTQTKMVALIK